MSLIGWSLWGWEDQEWLGFYCFLLFVCLLMGVMPATECENPPRCLVLTRRGWVWQVLLLPPRCIWTLLVLITPYVARGLMPPTRRPRLTRNEMQAKIDELEREVGM